MIYLFGNPTLDRIIADGQTVECFGGTVLYAALCLKRMGWSASVVGKGNRPLKSYLERFGIDTRHFQVADPVTRFENRYRQHRRTQRARAGAAINLAEIPPEAFSARAILAGPVLGELDPAVFAVPRSALLLADLQGFLRHRDSRGNVFLQGGYPSEKALANADIVKLDREEAEALIGPIDDPQQAADRLHAYGAGCVLLTFAGAGALVSGISGRHWLPAPRLDAVDSTGAGDVFATAFLVKYLESNGDLLESGRFAAAAAALSTQAFGAEGLAGRQSIAALLEEQKDRFA